MFVRRACGLALLSFLVSARAQDTRTEQIERQRQQKASHLEPDAPNAVERLVHLALGGRGLGFLSDKIPGFSIRLGGLVSGSGFALGPQYRRTTLADGNIFFRTSASFSIKNYQRYELEFGLPRLLADRASFDFRAVRHDYRSIDYYGPGPESKKTGRSDFHLTDNAFDATAALKPVRNFNVGLTGGYVMTDIAPGEDDRFASTTAIYSPAQTPGIDQPSNFLRGGPMVSFDYRDHPGNPREGGYYRANYLFYSDQEYGHYSFRRLNAEAQQYFPFFHKTHVIAVRAKTELSYTDSGNAVPFYEQPVLGGLDDLRGFRPFRFYGDNMIVMNGEYRYQIFSGVDLALFVDEGKVFQSHRDFSARHLEDSYGFGFRFSNEDHVFMRIETGFSREGFQVWFKFGDVF